MAITYLVLHLLLSPSLADAGQDGQELGLAGLEGGGQAIHHQDNIRQLLGRLQSVPDIIRIGINKLGLSCSF